jgi:hypothetical protein
MQIDFKRQGTFNALNDAQRWCKEHGISYGSTCARGPQCLLFGDWNIAKWHNLTDDERSQCIGTISGDTRNGPVTVYIKPEHEHRIKP